MTFTKSGVDIFYVRTYVYAYIVKLENEWGEIEFFFFVS